MQVAMEESSTVTFFVQKGSRVWGWGPRDTAEPHMVAESLKHDWLSCLVW